MNILNRLAAALALATGTLPALAASAAPAAAATTTAADPTQAQASVPPVQHRSAFSRYRALTDVAPIPWREANETVHRIGGWRAYAREAAAPEPAASAATPATASAPAVPTATPPLAPTTPRPQEHRHGR